MFQVPEHADGEDVPGGTAVAYENKILRFFQGLGVRIFHFAFLVEITKLAGQSNKHLHMEESACCKRLPKISHRRPVGKQVFLPGDELAHESHSHVNVVAFLDPSWLV